MKIALSPCPNDTYLFHAWISGHVGKHLPIEPIFGDIQHLNEWALEKKFPLIKLSFSTYAHVKERYQLLPVGSALGFNCGPKIIAKSFFPLDQLKNKKIAIPGIDTTAHLLLQRLCENPKEKHFCLYHEIVDLLNNDSVDCGLIIHESRFTFADFGFIEIADLGMLWDEKMKVPLPLGGLAIDRDLPDHVKKEVISILQSSLQFARSYPKEGLPFILQHSQEKDPLVVQQHIDTYVNQETEQLSLNGLRALEKLLNICLESCLFSPN